MKDSGIELPGEKAVVAADGTRTAVVELKKKAIEFTN